MPKAAPVKWSREQRLIALNLYFKLPFGKLHRGNPLIIEVAKQMGRTPSSLAIKLCNFASLDPVLQARGIVGMRGAANEDRQLWNDFHNDLGTFGTESEQLLHDLFTRNNQEEVDLLHSDQVQLEPSVKLLAPDGPTESSATVKVRRGQQFFRQTILNAYGRQCCITGINSPALLVASHIKPWSDFPANRLDPRNGLCLSSLHDAAFDAGLITLDQDFKLVLSKKLKSYFPQQVLEQNFVPFDGKSIRLPEQIAHPSEEFVGYHREEIFTG